MIKYSTYPLCVQIHYYSKFTDEIVRGIQITRI